MEIIAIIGGILCAFAGYIIIPWIGYKIQDAIENGDTSQSSQKAMQDQAARDILATALPTKQLTNMQEQKKGTRSLLLGTLTKMGWQYDLVDGENGRIHFAYQGEHFLVDAEDDLSHIAIYDYAWESVELYDIDEVARLRKAINEANWQNCVTTVFTINEAGKTMDVHSKQIVLFIQEIPDLEGYLKMNLNEFFRAHRMVGSELSKLREVEDGKE